ncbi:helix-turn-helix transcriptional regulator [Rhodobacteraceae bacterium NNCM2]|nr:helix-turn-helix transcriptional regulator [Coraliihabitans acroporae]
MDDYTDNAATFGDRLALAREQQGMTSAQLARRLGLKVSTVNNWEFDRSAPRANKIQMLAGLLNVSIVWLLTGEGEGAPVEEVADGSENLAEIGTLVTELRDLRVQQVQITERMSRLEKRLRAFQPTETRTESELCA